ncbi:MAG: hypothetical protein K9I82_17670, partial [Chitinophagaceae bacterium]|nr:hypothetical protein [Chitinophagaceae bacterium]
MNIIEVLIEETDIRFGVFKTLFPEILDWKSNGIQRWHFVIIDNDPEKCILKRGYSNNDSLEFCFDEIYHSLKEKSYERLLLLVTYYQVFPKDVLIQKLNESFYLPNYFTKDLLKENKNYRIAFSDQLEVLYRTLTGASPWEAIEFRRDINKKNQEAIRKAKQIKATQSLNIYALICQKSFYDSGPFFLTPNYYGA